MIKIKKDPLTIAISLIYNLNLLEEDKDYNIHELKFITALENHWITIQKYLQMFNLIQRYSPKIEFNGSKLRVTKSEIYRRLNNKEKFILHLYNNQAKDLEHAISINFDISSISNSIGYLFKKTEDNKYYLRKSGLEMYRYLKKDLSNLIYNNKEIDEIFGTSEEVLLSETKSVLKQEIDFIRPVLEEKDEELYSNTIFLKNDDSSSSKFVNYTYESMTS